jgi:predicted AlkP superfamily pyrophosphatase or phosphodiesterase
VSRRAVTAVVASLVLALAPACDAGSGAPSEPSRESAAGGPSPTTSGVADHDVRRVLVVSVDGLNPRALRLLGHRRAPHLHRLLAEGASTLEARTAVERTETLPNHTSMVTGRPVDSRHGGHGVTWNDARPEPATVHEAAGHRVASVFTVLRRAGLSSIVFVSKPKLTLWTRSWPAAVDRMVVREDNDALVRLAARDLRGRERGLTFVHLSRPDVVGHAEGYMSRDYLAAVAETDGRIGRLLDALEQGPAGPDGTALVLTSDHGGRGRSHGDPTRLVNQRIPFLVRGPGVAAGADLYDLNPDYADPGRGRPGYGAARQPVRNGAVADLVLDLLGLPPVPGSSIDADQDLDVR